MISDWSETTDRHEKVYKYELMNASLAIVFVVDVVEEARGDGGRWTRRLQSVENQLKCFESKGTYCDFLFV